MHKDFQKWHKLKEQLHEHETKFNLDVCLVVPLTARSKKGMYYFSVGEVAGRQAVAVLSQIRFIDRKRLALKMEMLDQNIFPALAQAVVERCFPYLSEK